MPKENTMDEVHELMKKIPEFSREAKERGVPLVTLFRAWLQKQAEAEELERSRHILEHLDDEEARIVAKLGNGDAYIPTACKVLRAIYNLKTELAERMAKHKADRIADLPPEVIRQLATKAEEICKRRCG
jgi:hypothetical protein